MAADDGRELLQHCLARDPRWDHQVESRAEYYADLALALDLPAAHIEVEAVDDEDTQSLRIDVLAAMAERGARGARELLLAALRPGPLDEHLLWRLANLTDQRGQEGLDQVIVARFPAAELRLLVADMRKGLPWDEWAATNDVIARAVREVDAAHVEARVQRPAPPPSDAPVDEILAYDWGFTPPKALLHRFTNLPTPKEVDAVRAAALEALETRRWFPLAVLARRNDPTAVEQAEQVFAAGVTGKHRAMASRYISALDAATTLPLARRWLSLADGRSSIATHLMGLHSEVADIPAIRSSLAGAWADREMYSLCSLIGALGRHPGTGPFPELREVFVAVDYAYARTRAARAMAAVDPEFIERFALECLWDCEAGTRLAGVSSVALTSEARDRLEELATRGCDEARIRLTAAEGP